MLYLAFLITACLAMPLCLIACKHNHELVYVSAVSSTCDTDGNVGYWKCNDCKRYFSDSEGEIEIEDVAIKKTGHIAGEWIVDVEPSCTSAGVKHKECEVCNVTLQTQGIEKLAHTESSEWIIDKESSCTETGSKHKKCEVCDTTLQTQEIEKLQHDVSDWIETQQATCIAQGEEVKKCLVCDTEIETRKTSVTSHHLIYTSDATKHSSKCRDCFQIFDVDVEHNYQDNVCSVCGYFDFDCISPIDGYTLGQIYSEDHVFNPTHNYWAQHLGVDFTAPAGSEVKCIFDGVVKEVVSDAYSGTVVTIDHGYGYVSIYKLMSDTTVQVGDEVSQGEVIGKVSDSALEEIASGTHLHLEVQKDKQSVNPLSYMSDIVIP